MIQIYLGYKRKTVYKKFFGVKKIWIAGDAKVLKWRIPIFQTFSGRTDYLVRNVFKIYILLSSRNTPPEEEGGALRDDTKNGCVAH